MANDPAMEEDNISTRGSVPLSWTLQPPTRTIPKADISPRGTRR